MIGNLKPSNIDFLHIGNKCNLNCLQCFYREESVTIINNRVSAEIQIAKKIINKFPDSAFFLYPMEITTSMEVGDVFPSIGQTSILSNGIDLSYERIVSLKSNGIKQIKITFFATFEEHSFFYHINKEQYNKIEEAIKMCRNLGVNVVVNNILSKNTVNSITKLARMCSDLGVDIIEFLRIKPIGNAERIVDDIWLDEGDLFQIIERVEYCKINFPNIYYRYNISLGVDFYGKSLNQAAEKVAAANSEWTKSRFLCPAIDGNYLGISMKTGNVYSCFFAMNFKDFTIGFFDFDELKICQLGGYFLSSSDISANLRGNCHIDRCQYHKSRKYF